MNEERELQHVADMSYVNQYAESLEQEVSRVTILAVELGIIVVVLIVALIIVTVTD